MADTPEESARAIEEHIQVLADYDVIPVDVAETLTEYVWKILAPAEYLDNVRELRDIWDRNSGEKSPDELE